jgi:hypothetical protein
MPDLNELYKQLFADIRKSINEGHHPMDISLDSPALIDDIKRLIGGFHEAVQNECDNDNLKGNEDEA